MTTEVETLKRRVELRAYQLTSAALALEAGEASPHHLQSAALAYAAAVRELRLARVPVNHDR